MTKNSPITKTYLDKSLDKFGKRIDANINKAVQDVLEPMHFLFEKNEQAHQQIFKKLDSMDSRLAKVEDRLENIAKRVRFIESVVTDHSDNFKQIKAMLAEIQQSKQKDRKRIATLEEKVDNYQVRFLRDK